MLKSHEASQQRPRMLPGEKQVTFLSPSLLLNELTCSDRLPLSHGNGDLTLPLELFRKLCRDREPVDCNHGVNAMCLADARPLRCTCIWVQIMVFLLRFR